MERNRGEYRKGAAEPSHTVECVHTHCQQNPVTLWHVCTHTVSAEPSHTVTCEHTHCVSPLTSVEEHEANDRLFYVHLELVPTEDDALDDDPVWVHRQE